MTNRAGMLEGVAELIAQQNYFGLTQPDMLSIRLLLQAYLLLVNPHG